MKGLENSPRGGETALPPSRPIAHSALNGFFRSRLQAVLLSLGMAACSPKITITPPPDCESEETEVDSKVFVSEPSDTRNKLKQECGLHDKNAVTLKGDELRTAMIGEMETAYKRFWAPVENFGFSDVEPFHETQALFCTRSDSVHTGQFKSPNLEGLKFGDRWPSEDLHDPIIFEEGETKKEVIMRVVVSNPHNRQAERAMEAMENGKKPEPQSHVRLKWDPDGPGDQATPSVSDTYGTMFGYYGLEYNFTLKREEAGTPDDPKVHTFEAYCFYGPGCPKMLCTQEVEVIAK